MKMRPMGDQLLLLPSKKEDRTESGIILAGVEESNGYAEVIAAGPGIFTQTGDRIPMACKVGDMVLLPNRLISSKGGNEVKFEDKTYCLVRESEVLMVSSK